MWFLVVVPLLLVLAGVGLSTARVLPAMYGLGLFALGALFGLGVSINILMGSFSGELQNVCLPIAIALLPLAVGVSIAVSDLRYPRINDVTTDVENPPEFLAALETRANSGRDMSFPERFGPIIRRAYPYVRSQFLDETPQQVFRRIVELAEARSDWEITKSDAEKWTIEGETSTFFFRFVDDFVFRVSDQNGKAQVDMRSKSRDGLVDAGANAKRIRSFFAELTGKDPSSSS